tara:strand:+ start:843 stop:1724 length:882 start_codon:yes stop_codon:yes gene_type:complete
MQKIFYFFYAIRPKTLIASFSPVFLVSILCYKINLLNWSVCFFTIFASLLLQIMSNLINDLYDFRKGADNKDRIGPSRMIQKGYLTDKEMVYYIYIVFLFALLIGIYLVSIGGIVILLIGLSSFLFAYLYTATSLSIAYNGLGEIFVFLYFGIIAALGSYYLQTLEYSHGPLLIGMITGCLNTNLLIINNIRDYLSDKKAHKNTLVVKFGVFFGKVEFIVFFILSYIILFIFAFNYNNFLIFSQTLPVLVLGLYFVFKFIYYNSFIASKALPLFSLYILLFTLLLAFNIYYGI